MPKKTKITPKIGFCCHKLFCCYHRQMSNNQEVVGVMTTKQQNEQKLFFKSIFQPAAYSLYGRRNKG